MVCGWEEADSVDGLRAMLPGVDEILWDVVFLGPAFFVEVDVHVPRGVHVGSALVVVLGAPVEICRFHVGEVVLVVCACFIHGRSCFGN